MSESSPSRLMALDVERPIWGRVFTVAPLVVIGSREAGGAYNLAPKHMAFPLGWQNFFGFICTPRHSTYQNIQREGVFTVSFPRPDHVLLPSLAASPRCDDDTKPALEALPTFPASAVPGVFLRHGYLFLECRLEKIVDGFGDNSLIAGRIVAAQVAEEALRSMDVDDRELLERAPLLAYLSPGRFASVGESFSFPFPEGFQRGDS